jgi:hypothetical protein
MASFSIGLSAKLAPEYLSNAAVRADHERVGRDVVHLSDRETSQPGHGAWRPQSYHARSRACARSRTICASRQSSTNPTAAPQSNSTMVGSAFDWGQRFGRVRTSLRSELKLRALPSRFCLKHGAEPLTVAFTRSGASADGRRSGREPHCCHPRSSIRARRGRVSRPGSPC